MSAYKTDTRSVQAGERQSQKEHPRQLNEVILSGSGRNPLGVAALLRTRKLFVSNSAHT